MTAQEKNIPYGFCHCGCGRKTNISPVNYAQRGWVRGKPRLFVFGHHSRQLRSKVEAITIEGHPCLRIPLTKGYFSLIYSEDAGKVIPFVWSANVQPNGRVYAVRKAHLPDGRYVVIRMHRVIVGLEYEDKREVDHVNGDQTLDNRRCNLRIVDRTHNMWNKRPHSNAVSGMKGAFLKRDTGKYESRITVHKKKIHLGTFATAEEAHAAYCEAAAFYFGEHARLR
jgi:hypothetical protein